MYLKIFIPQILREMWLHKLRSGLAIFCIAFGTFALMMLLALNTGFHEASERSFMDIVDGSFYVWQQNNLKTHQGHLKGQANDIMIKDVMELPKIFPNITVVSPQLGKSALLNYAGKANTRMVGVAGPGYLQIGKIKLVTGSRFFNQVDIEQRARVAVISSEIEKLFFEHRGALGSKLFINGIPFTVIGILSKKARIHGMKDVLISYQSYLSLFGDEPVWQFQVLTKPDTDPIQFEQMLRGYFAQKFHFDKNDRDAMGFWGAHKVYNFLRWFLLAVQLFLSACGMMVLAVGGIGVANIMFLIVTERTYEIGLRKAIGATNRQIFLQLLFEVLIIVGIGGGLGIAAAFFTTTFLQHITLPDWIGVPTLSWVTAFITVIILALIGLVAGFFPAAKAAQMDPIEALMGNL